VLKVQSERALKFHIKRIFLRRKYSLGGRKAVVLNNCFHICP